jgi:hypothetical protein
MNKVVEAGIIKDVLREAEISRAVEKGTEVGFANIMYDRLMIQIAEFEKDLDSEHEIGAMLASFGKEVVIQIESIGYQNPYFVVFYGLNIIDGSKVKLVQHVSQINVLFISIKIKEDRLPRRIGFIDK